MFCSQQEIAKMLSMAAFILTVTNYCVNAQDVTCNQQFCDAYKTCPELHAGCLVPNQTHNGLILPYPGPCNCCEYCLENLGLGQNCAVGSPTSTIPKNICGSGLSCDRNTCQQIDTECTKKQRDYDERRNIGELGHLEPRPNCDRNGQYEPFRCIPGEICHCVSEEGQRIFGEITFTTIASTILTCGCSRGIDKISKLLGRPLKRHEYLRCRPDGSYDSIQCIGTRCICVDVVDGTPTYPRRAPVNMNSISETSLPCFSSNSHIRYEYYRACEEKYMKKLRQMHQLVSEGLDVYGASFPRCQLDGRYMAVQQSDTRKYCADPNGDIIEPYVIDLNMEQAPTEDMDCKCARTNLLNNEDIEKQSCCQNGNYNQRQCRRGVCRCVDNDGHQIPDQKEVHISQKNKLPCESCIPDD